MARFEQFVDMFMEPEKFQAKMKQFKDASDDAKKQLDKVKIWGEVESAHGEITSLLNGANSRFQQAKEALDKAEKDGEKLIQEASESVKATKKAVTHREENVSLRESLADDKETEVRKAVSKNEKTLAEILSKISYLEDVLKKTIAEADLSRIELSDKLIKVNQLLGA